MAESLADFISTHGTLEEQRRAAQIAKLVPQAARLDDAQATPFHLATRSDLTDPRLIVVLSDQQVPYHDKHLHQLTCAFLNFHRPNHLVVLGDLLDNPTLSKHPRNPDLDAPLQQCIDEAYRVLKDYKEAAGPAARRYYVPGNHEERVRRYLIDKAPELYGVRRAGDIHACMSLPQLLRLDELGYVWMGLEGYDYAHAELVIPPAKIMFVHGDKVRAKSGASGLVMMEEAGRSIVHGHTHRQAMVYQTKWDIDSSPTTHVAIETGTMAQWRLGYAPRPNWQRGFLTIWVHPDGLFHASHAHYINQTLLWQDERYGG